MNRYIALEGTFNFRDIGGFAAKDGKTVTMGQLYRSDALYKLTDADRAELTRRGIRTVVDFRKPDEAAAAPNLLPDGVSTVVLAPHAELARVASADPGDDEGKIRELEQRVSTPEGRAKLLAKLDGMAEQMRSFVTSESGIAAYAAFLKLLAQEESTPLIFHCKGGKDRTGWGAALILSLLGVSRADIIEDYMATAQYNTQRNQKRLDEYRAYTDNPDVLTYLASLMQVKQMYIEASFEEVDKLGGINRYVREVLKLSEAEIDALETKFLTGKDVRL